MKTKGSIIIDKQNSNVIVELEKRVELVSQRYGERKIQNRRTSTRKQAIFIVKASLEVTKYLK